MSCVAGGIWAPEVAELQRKERVGSSETISQAEREAPPTSTRLNRADVPRSSLDFAFAFPFPFTLPDTLELSASSLAPNAAPNFWLNPPPIPVIPKGTPFDRRGAGVCCDWDC